VLEDPEVDTVVKGYRKLVQKHPNHELLGTRVGDKYEWQTTSQVLEKAELISLGMKALNLAPEVDADGETMRFMGIQSKNRLEWVLFFIANML